MNSGTRLLLARHGHAHCNLDNVVGGPHGCTGLTARGRRQAAQLATRLHQLNTHTPITALYTSPIRRVTETSALVAATLQLPAQYDPALAEPDYGDADGRPWPEVIARFGKIPARHPDLPIAPGAESWQQHYHRVSAALRALLDQHPGETITVIGHGETITAAAHLLLDLPPETRARALFAAHNASITTWEQQPLSWTRPEAGFRWALTGHNDTSHLTRQCSRLT